MIVECVTSTGRRMYLKVNVYGYGPDVQFYKQSILDFDLINYGLKNCQKSLTFTLANYTNIPANFSLNKANHPILPFLKANEFKLIELEDSNDIMVIYNKQLNKDIEKQSSILLFKPCRGIIPPSSTIDINCTFKPNKIGPLRSFIECHIEHSNTQYLAIRADVEIPQLSIYPIAIQLDTYPFIKEIPTDNKHDDDIKIIHCI